MRRGLGRAWLGRQDSNLRMPVPKTGALPLGDAPAGAPQCAGSGAYNVRMERGKSFIAVNEAPVGRSGCLLCAAAVRLAKGVSCQGQSLERAGSRPACRNQEPAQSEISPMKARSLSPRRSESGRSPGPRNPWRAGASFLRPRNSTGRRSAPALLQQPCQSGTSARSSRAPLARWPVR